MRSSLFLTIVFVVSLSLFGCSTPTNTLNKNSTPTTPKVESQTPSSSNKASEPPAPTEDTVQKIDNPNLQLAKEGKIDGIKFSLGTSAQKVYNELGKPDETGYFGGGYYLVYGNVTYYSDGFDDLKGEIGAIGIGAPYSLYGVKLGMKPEEIVKILGQPGDEGIIPEGHEVAEGEWGFTYFIGDYYIMFYSETKTSPTYFVEVGFYK